MVLTQKTAASLFLPPHAVTPLQARTFAANIYLKTKKTCCRILKVRGIFALGKERS
jgi:hypothetical protein